MKHVVGVADMKISGEAGDCIITHALGSCLGVTIHDPVAAVGGLLHAMLPDSTVDLAKAQINPYMFVDTGVPQLFKGCYALGAVKNRLIISVAGGACVHGDEETDLFQIGKRNFIMLRKLFWKNGVLITHEDVGGHLSRTVSLEVGTGAVTIRSNGETRQLKAA